VSNQERPAPTGYAGLVTRAVAYLLDALIVDGIAILVGGAVSLIASLLGHTGELSGVEAVAGGVAWLLWSLVYFVTFWNLTGQTPGDRLLGIRVLSTESDDISLRQAAWRFAWMVLSLIPLGAGFLPILFDDQRRGLHDRMAHTIVRWEAKEQGEIPPPVAEVHVREVEAPSVPVTGHEVPIG
jgi:uncharacterized RDD family membrane protein YckC